MSQNKIFEEKFNLHLIKSTIVIIFSLSLITGPFIPDLLVSLAAIYILYNLKNNYKNYIFSSNYILFFFIFWFYLVINSFFSTVPQVSLQSTIPYIRFVLFLIFIKTFLNNNRILKFLIISFLLIYFLLLLDGLFQLKSGFNLLGFPLDGSKRISSVFADKLILGSFVSKTFVVVIFLIFFLNLKHKYIIYIVTIFLSGVLIYLSRERSAMFVYVVITTLSLLLVEKKILLKMIFLLLFLLSSVVIINNDPLQRLYFHTKQQLNETKNIFPSARHYLHYLTAYQIFKESPILGKGVKSFRYLCDNDRFKTKDEILINLSENFYTNSKGYFYKTKIFYDEIRKINIFAILILDDSFYTNFKNDLNNEAFLKEILDVKSSHNSAILERIDVLTEHFSKIYVKNGQYLSEKTLVASVNPFKNGCSTHPHNFYIQILSETGFIGFSFIILFYFFIIKGVILRIYDYIKNNKISADIVIYGFYFALFAPFLTSGNFFNNYLSLSIYIPFGFLLLYQRK